MFPVHAAYELTRSTIGLHRATCKHRLTPNKSDGVMMTMMVVVVVIVMMMMMMMVVVVIMMMMGSGDDVGGVVGQRRIQRANPAMAPIDICYGRSPPSRRRR